jgi:DNA gyrase subunit B
MPQLIERGHLYIAQPPLYGAKRGNDLKYLKNDAALDDYLLDKALGNATLTLADDTRLAGRELAAEARWLREAHGQLKRLAETSIPLALLEQAAIAGVLTPDSARAQAGAQDLAARLDAIALPNERGWKVVADGTTLQIARIVRGVAERYSFDAAALRSAEARWLADRAERIARGFGKPAILKLDSQEVPVAGPATAFERMLLQGRRGLTLQRFKGLGEMNADQLWKTTLDPEERTLLQVRVGDIEEAGQVFSTLMGDVVEPRRDFIVGNALKVANLDV